MFAEETKPISVSVNVRFARFHLSDRAYGPRNGDRTAPGLLVVSPGQVTCTTGALTHRVHLTVDTTSICPDDALAHYEDVVESSYDAPTGMLAVLDWAGTEVLDLPPLPAGPGEYRIRYHARGLDDEGGVGTCLLQIWPAPAGPATELKISSETGAFWHPHARLTAPITEASNRSNAAVGRNRSTPPHGQAP